MTAKIGDRYLGKVGEYTVTYVLVGFQEDTPVYVTWEPGDPTTHEYMGTEILEQHEEAALTPAPDAATSAQVLAAYEQYRQTAKDAHDALTPLEQVIQFGTEEWRQSVRDAVADYKKADQAWKDQQAAVTKAARARAVEMRNVRFLLGTQTATAKALDIDQSNVSRALALLDDKSIIARILDLG
jgi:hypothetical protein